MKIGVIMAGGRPTKMTPETVSKLEEAFMWGCSDVEACLYADISKQTLYDYQTKHPEYVDRKQSLKENLKLQARRNLSNSISIERDTDNSKWYLERKVKDEFSLRQETTGKDGEPLKVSDVTQLILSKHTTEELEAILESQRVKEDE